MTKDKKEKEIIDYSLKDLDSLNGYSDMVDLERKIERNPSFARLILFLGFAFLKQKRVSVTGKEINQYVRKSYDYTVKMTEILTNHVMLGKVKRDRQNRYFLKDELLLKSLIPLAKKVVFENNKLGGEKDA